MRDIHEVLRQKQAKYAALGKQIEALQQAAEVLREVAPLLAENEDDGPVLAVADEAGDSMAAKAGASGGASSGSKAARSPAPRWP